MAHEKRVHIAHILFSFDTGGMEKGIATVIQESVSEFKHTIICLTRSGRSAQLLPNDVQVIEMHKKEGNSLFFIFRLARLLRKIRPDIVHTRNWGGVDGLIASKFAGISRIFHGEHGWSMDDPFGRNPKRVMIRRLLDLFVTRYTCVSQQIEKWLQKDIKVRRPVGQVYSGVDCNRYMPGNGVRQRMELGICEDVVVFGIVARLDPIKNHPSLIRAFNTIHKTFRNTRLLIIGGGAEEDKLRLLAQEGILLLGNRSDIPALLRCMDVFVLPSFNEGVSNTILEAMASGLPVIASDRGGNPELVEDGKNGMLIDPDRISEIERCMSRYVRDPDLRQRHGRAGRIKTEKSFSISGMAQGYCSLWRIS